VEEEKPKKAVVLGRGAHAALAAALVSGGMPGAGRPEATPAPSERSRHQGKQERERRVRQMEHAKQKALRRLAHKRAQAERDGHITTAWCPRCKSIRCEAMR
jgi:hypothetical protein